MKKCSVCGKKHEDSSSFCDECGNSLPKKEEVDSGLKGNVVAGDIDNSQHHHHTDNSQHDNSYHDHSYHDHSQHHQHTDNSHHSSVVNNFYNQPTEKKPDVKCKTCGEIIPSVNMASCQCHKCKDYFCYNHMDVKKHLCHECDLTEAFEVSRHSNGKFSILRLKDKYANELIIPESVEAIEERAFEESSIMKVELPNGLLKIGARAFANCKDLCEINFPPSLRSIDKEAFAGSGNVDSTCVSKNTRVHETAFDKKKKAAAGATATVSAPKGTTATTTQTAITATKTPSTTTSYPRSKSQKRKKPLVGVIVVLLVLAIGVVTYLEILPRLDNPTPNNDGTTNQGIINNGTTDGTTQSKPGNTTQNGGGDTPTYAASNLALAVVDKISPADESAFEEGTIFNFSLTNNGVHAIWGFDGTLNIYHASGDILFTGDWSDCIGLQPGATTSIELTLTNNNLDSAFELYYADLEDLRATFRITCLTYGDAYNTEERYFDDPAVSVLELGPNSDGISRIEHSYLDAKAAYDAKNYTEAMNMFVALGNYRDSAEYVSQCVIMQEQEGKEKKYNSAMALLEEGKYGEAIKILKTIKDYKNSAYKIDEIVMTIETLAIEAGEVGKYDEAYNHLISLGYTESSNDLCKAYSLAMNGNFPEAAQYGLTHVYLPDGMIMIPDNYLKSTKIEKIVIPASVKSIGKNAFYSCEALTEVAFSEGLKSIGESAFRSSGIKAVTLPSTLETIGDYAFQYTEIATLMLPDSLVTVGDYAFEYCEKLVTLKAAGQTIGQYAFHRCDKLTTVTFAEGVEIIGVRAFYECEKLSSVTLPESLQSIGERSFSLCDLKSITIPAGVTYIGPSSFEYSGLTNAYFAEPEGWVNPINVRVSFSDPHSAANKLNGSNAYTKD